MQVATYYRVSSEEQVEAFSIDAQRRACRDFVTSKDHVLVAEYFEEGRSARSDSIDKRPEFRRMLDDAEAGRFEAVIVHKQDRFARNQLVLYSSLNRLEHAGVRFFTAAEDIDYTSSTGKLTLGVKGSVAEWYSNNLSEETKKGKTERKAQGHYNGLLPFGASKDSNGAAVPDKTPRESLGGNNNYAGLLLMFRLAAEGHSDREIAVALNAAGFRTTGNRPGNLFSRDTIRPILTNRFYLGMLPVGRREEWVAGIHAPYWKHFPADLWQAAQVARRRNSTKSAASSVPGNRPTYSLSGLVRSAECGGAMHIVQQSGRQSGPRIYCYNSRQGRSRCESGGALDFYEKQLERYLSDLVIPDNYVEILVKAQSRERAERDILAERRRIQERIDRLNDVYYLGGMTREQYATKLKTLQNQLPLLEEHSNQEDRLRRLCEYLRNIPAAWASANQAQRNKLVRTMVDGLQGSGSRLIACKPRADLACFWQLIALSTDVTRGGTDGERLRVSPKCLTAL